MFVPILTTPAGACLTPANWLETGCSVFSYHLDVLLFRPGLAFLKKQHSLKAALACPGALLLNARALIPNAAGNIVLRSPYDGSTLSLTEQALFDLVAQLKPDHVSFHGDAASGFIESDAPCADAMAGRVYTSTGLLDLRAYAKATCFEPIDPTCTCPSCSAPLTQAYLHHLYAHTPLLCQRFLAQHNAYWFNRKNVYSVIPA